MITRRRSRRSDSQPIGYWKINAPMVIIATKIGICVSVMPAAVP